MSPLITRTLIFVAVAGTYAWMLRAAPDRETAVMFQFNIFVPMLIILGVAGLARAVYHAQNFGWRHDDEGLAVFSLLAFTWGHDNSWALIRRVAQSAGYDPAWMLNSDYRLFSGTMVILAIFLVFRWATRREVTWLWRWPQYLAADVAGELPWTGFAIILMGFVVYQSDAIARLLVWVYTLL